MCGICCCRQSCGDFCACVRSTLGCGRWTKQEQDEGGAVVAVTVDDDIASVGGEGIEQTIEAKRKKRCCCCVCCGGSNKASQGISSLLSRALDFTDAGNVTPIAAFIFIILSRIHSSSKKDDDSDSPCVGFSSQACCFECTCRTTSGCCDTSCCVCKPIVAVGKLLCFELRASFPCERAPEVPCMLNVLGINMCATVPQCSCSNPYRCLGCDPCCSSLGDLHPSLTMSTTEQPGFSTL